MSHTLQEQQMLDSMIVEIVVEPSKEEGKVRIKFYAIAGGCGPEINMDPSLLQDLHSKINTFLKEHPEFSIGG